jgi:hypothetical protein
VGILPAMYESFKIKKELLDRVRKFIAGKGMTLIGFISLAIENELKRRK